VSADNGNGHAAEPEEAVDHAALAAEYERWAAESLASGAQNDADDVRNQQIFAEAHVAALLALSHRTAHQTEQIAVLGGEANRVLMGIEGAVG